MKRYLEQLKPLERRWLAGIAFVVFVVLNYWFVWPHFKEWDLDKKKMETSLNTLAKFHTELNHKSEYDRKIRDLESQESVPPEDQVIEFDRFYNNRARENKVLIMNSSRPTTRSNAFFLEHEVSLSVQAGEKELVNFLYSLGDTNSLVRVRAMSLRPDGPHQLLNANVTIVASYQKNQKNPASQPAKPVKVAAAPAPPGAPVAPVQKTEAPGSKLPMIRTNKGPDSMPRMALSTNKPGPLKLKSP
jgi:hypothetical protein